MSEASPSLGRFQPASGSLRHMPKPGSRVRQTHPAPLLPPQDYSIHEDFAAIGEYRG